MYDELVEKFYEIETIDINDLVKKLTATQKLKLMKRENFPITNILLLTILINFQVQYLMKD